MKRRAGIQMFIPAVFCGFIAIMDLFMGENANPAFFAFLPMCFFFAALPLIAMNKRLTDLEEKLKQRDDDDA